MVEAAPPVFGSKDDHYLREAVQKAETARFFRKHAKRPEYLQWAKNHGVLKPLFSAEQLDEAGAQIAEWFIYHCIPSHHEEALTVFQELGATLNPTVSRHIADALHYGKDPGFKSVFSRWAAILLSHAPAILRYEQWELLLHSCSWPNERDIALLLLERCFCPLLLVKKSFDFFAGLESEDDKTTLDYEVNIAEENSYCLQDAWGRLFKPHFAELVDQIEFLVTSNLEKASALLRIGGKTEPLHDPLGFRRRNIRERSSLGGSHVLDVLIDAALDVMDFYIENDNQVADRLIARWGTSKSPI
jgi:hypothetical protein